MEGIGSKLNVTFLRNSLRLKEVTDRTVLFPFKSSSYFASKSSLHMLCKPSGNLLNSRSDFTPFWSYVRPIYTSRRRFNDGDVTDKFNKSRNTNDLLEKDVELQSYLKDIMMDFNDSSPPNQPPKTKQSLNRTEEISETSKTHEPCGGCGIQKDIPHSTEGRFKIFDDSNTEEILDFDEEQQEGFYLYQEKKNELEKYEFQRGQEGVFDIEELVTVLHQENAADLVVLSVPDHLHYCKYLVIVTARSPRHLKALAEFLKKLYKKKKSKSDPFIITEGKDCKDWKVLDMSQIVLHLFLEATRTHYDLETLWAVGEQYDDLSNLKQDPVLDLLQQHIQYLDEIEPLPVSKEQ